MTLITSLVLTICICKTQCGSVEAPGFSGPGGQTDGPAPARARSTLGLGQRHIGIWRLVEDLQVQKETLITQYKYRNYVFLYSLTFQHDFYQYSSNTPVPSLYILMN